MRVKAVPWQELRPDLALRWIELRRRNPALVSPYFHPKFTGIIAEACANVEVAVIDDGSGEVAALLPYHRMRGNVGVPAGHYLSDYHGLICEPDFDCDPCEVLRQCRLIAWDFDHLIATQRCFAPFHQMIEPSPQIDLSNGFDAYCRQNRSLKKEQIKIRGIERNVGPLRLVLHSADPVAMQQLLIWKSQQYVRTGVQDIFTQPWVTTVVESIHRTQDQHFAGILSLLYAGDRLGAVHFGMRSGTVLHSWFSAYDRTLADYSPGIILLLRVAENAPSLGIDTIDLGKGMNEHKQRFMNSSTLLASGSVEVPSWRYLGRATRKIVKSFIIRSHLERPARAAIGIVRRVV
jgi:CelD/BcsL family acetyltransferase involved in cellulose biosynthesis